MICNLKAFGLALVAVFAMSGMVASAASAASFTFETGAKTVTGEEFTQAEILFTGTGVKCDNVSLHANVAAGTFSSLTVTPVYTECTSYVGSATFTGFGHVGEANKCHYVFKADGKLDLACSGGAEVTYTAATCQVHIPAQTNIGTITYDTGLRATKHDLTLTLNLAGIKANHTDGFLCPMNGGSGVASSATIAGSVTFWAENANGEAVGVTHHP